MIENYKNMDAVFEQIFGYKPSKRGKGFEMLVGAVLKIINEAKDVTHDVKKTGLFSPDRYQIVVLVDEFAVNVPSTPSSGTDVSP